MALGGINRTAWGTKLLLTTVLASLMDSASLCHIMKAWHCSLGAYSSSPTPTAHPPPIDSIRDITGTEENYPKKQQHSNSL